MEVNKFIAIYIQSKSPSHFLMINCNRKCQITYKLDEFDDKSDVQTYVPVSRYYYLFPFDNKSCVEATLFPYCIIQ